MSHFQNRLLCLSLTAILGWLCLRHLLPICGPFLLAFLFALAAEPLVSFLHRRANLSRAVAAGIGMSFTLVAAAILLLMLLALLLRQLQSLAGTIPDLEISTQQGIQSLQEWLLSQADHAPSGIRPLVTQSIQSVFQDGSSLVNQLLNRLLNLATELLSRLPDSALGAATWLLACYMLSAKLPQLRSFLLRKLPEEALGQHLPALRNLKDALFGWLKAQLKLLGITFLLLLLGFLLLQIRYAPLLAAVISLVDALPILGAAIVLIPWSIICFLQGNTIRAMGLLGICAVTVFLRSLLETKLIGKHMGLDPLVTLLAIYGGYRLWGITGLFFAPLLAVLITQLMGKKNPEYIPQQQKEPPA